MNSENFDNKYPERVVVDFQSTSLKSYFVVGSIVLGGVSIGAFFVSKFVSKKVSEGMNFVSDALNQAKLALDSAKTSVGASVDSLTGEVKRATDIVSGFVGGIPKSVGAVKEDISLVYNEFMKALGENPSGEKKFVIFVSDKELVLLDGYSRKVLSRLPYDFKESVEMTEPQINNPILDQLGIKPYSVNVTNALFSQSSRFVSDLMSFVKRASEEYVWDKKVELGGIVLEIVCEGGQSAISDLMQFLIVYWFTNLKIKGKVEQSVNCAYTFNSDGLAYKMV